MKHFFKFAPVILLCVLLSGCIRTGNPEPTTAYVTQIRVVGNYRGRMIQRDYTQNEKMETVLHYLRTLDPQGYVHWDPKRLPGSVFRITLTLSNGKERHYLQRADRYLTRNGSSWKNIDRFQARDLYALLLLTPSDL